MSSLLAYGQGILSNDIGSGAGLTEPWGPPSGWPGDGPGEESSKRPANTEHHKDLSGEISDSRERLPDGGGSGGGGGLKEFFNVIRTEAPPLALLDAEPKSQNGGNLPRHAIVRASTKDLLHWDSPPQSPISSFVHLPLAVLTTVAAGTKADVVLVGVFQDTIGSNSILETFFCLPKGLGIPDYVTFKPELLACITGKLKSLENLNLPAAFSKALGSRPEAFLASRFHMQTFDGIILGLWRDFSQVAPTAEAVFADCVKCLPVMLSNRFNIKKYERLSRRFDAILKVIPDAVMFVADEDAQVVLNPAAAALLKLDHHGEVDPNKVAVAMRALNERCTTRTDPQHWPGLLSKKDKEMEIEEDWELENPRCVLHVRSYPVGGRTAHGRLWIYEDVTSQKDAELEMENAIKAKSQFLAMMSHELRTPMTGVLGMLDLLHLTDLEEEQQMLVRIMQESAEGLMDVINNILDYCKIEAGRVQLEDIDFSLTEVLEQMQAMLKTSLLKKALKLSFSQERCGTNIVRGDPVRLRQILLNLVSNAIKFTEDGNVSVSCRFLDPQWEDTTVVATSQSSSGKSKLINQIINASRGEKCTVEHSTASGRSVIVVNFSKEGAAGRYLELPSISSLQYSRLRLFSDANHQVVHLPPAENSLTGTHTINAPIRSSGPLSFPVSYSLQAGGVNPISAPMPSQIAETRYRFTERKCIAGKESSRNPRVSSNPSFSSQGTSSTVTWVGSTITTASYTQTARFGGDSLQLDEAGALRPSKYQRLSLEPSGDSLHQQSQHSLASTSHRSTLEQQRWDHEYPGIDTYPKWMLALKTSPGALKSQTSSWNPSEDNSNRSSIGTARQNVQLEERGSDTGHDESPPVGGTFPFGRSERSLMTGPEIASTGVDLHQSVCDESSQTSKRTREETKCINPDEKVWLEVKVEDTGVGIGQDQLKRLFVGSHGGSARTDYTKGKGKIAQQCKAASSGFNQLQDVLNLELPVRRNAAGTGLGLCIVKGLLCLMNGKIQIDSKIGEGTTVLMTVPLLPAANEHLNDILQNNSPIHPSTGERHALQSVPDAKPLLSDSKSSAKPENRFSPAMTSSSSVVPGGSETTSLPESVEGKHAGATNAGILPAKAIDAVSGADTKQKGQNSAPRGEGSGARAPKSQQLRILVAEDNRVNQLLIRKMFKHLGQENVEMVGNGKLAVEAVQRSAFDLVLMDVQMPILDGLSAVKAIRGLHPPASQLPIYALSADAPGSGPLSETGLDGYLKKPIVWSTVSELLARTASSKDKQA